MKRKTAHITAENNPEVTVVPATEELGGATKTEVVPESVAATEALHETETLEATAMQKVEASSSEETMASEPAAPSAAAKILPALGESLGKAVYGTFYYASYGIVFGTLMVTRLLPMNNLVGRAIKQGAGDAVDALQTPVEADVAASAMEEGASVLHA